MKFPIETPRKQVNWDPKGWYLLLSAALALPPPPGVCAPPRVEALLLPAACVLRQKNAPGNSSKGGRRVEAAWVPNPDSACHYHIVIVPPGLLQNLFKDTSSWLFGLKLHQVSVFAFDFVCVPVCVCPLFLVIFVSLADGWGASPWTWGCCAACSGCPQWERFPGSKWSSDLQQQSLEVALLVGRA